MTRSWLIPPPSRHLRLYCACPGCTPATSLVTTLLRKASASRPSTLSRPICDTSKRPATLRTARCSSRIEVYCCGISQPPKSTMRPPRATCRSYSGVCESALAVKCVEIFECFRIDGVGFDEGQQLFVVAAARVGYDLVDV